MGCRQKWCVQWKSQAWCKEPVILKANDSSCSWAGAEYLLKLQEEISCGRWQDNKLAGTGPQHGRVIKKAVYPLDNYCKKNFPSFISHCSFISLLKLNLTNTEITTNLKTNISRPSQQIFIGDPLQPTILQTLNIQLRIRLSSYPLRAHTLMGWMTSDLHKKKIMQVYFMPLNKSLEQCLNSTFYMYISIMKKYCQKKKKSKRNKF